MIPGAPKTDIDSYFDQTKPNIKKLIEKQLKEMECAKTIMTLWVRWKKPIMPLIELDPEDAKNARELDGITGDNYIRVEMLFNSLMTELLQGSNINDLIQGMLAHINYLINDFEKLAGQSLKNARVPMKHINIFLKHLFQFMIIFFQK